MDYLRLARWALLEEQLKRLRDSGHMALVSITQRRPSKLPNVPDTPERVRLYQDVQRWRPAPRWPRPRRARRRRGCCPGDPVTAARWIYGDQVTVVDGRCDPDDLHVEQA